MENYYLGLDMGTGSVGWAVTDEHYHLKRAKGKNLWGVRLFETAKTAADRRGYRVSRRRRQREVARMGMLRSFFDEEISKVDPGFFARLDDSKFHLEERAENNKQKFSLFADYDYTDADYYKEYPTIFHLRKELLESREPHDVRLIYLAIANLYKRRGHFLDASLEGESDSDSMDQLCENLRTICEELEMDFPVNLDANALEEKIGAKGISRKKMSEDVCELWQVTKKSKSLYAMICLVCGLSVKMTDLFDGKEVIDEEHKKLSLCFRDTNYEENSEEVHNIIGDAFWELIYVLKSIHDKGMLSAIMKGHDYLSQARVASYEAHKKDLNELKVVLKKYDVNAYNEMFRSMGEHNYSAYVGSVYCKKEEGDKQKRRGGSKNRDEFLKYVKNVLSKLSDEAKEDEVVKGILKRIEDDIFMPKQLTASNGVIPNQLHLREMSKILKNAETYLPFLAEKDENGLTISDKILRVYKFQIPYYVGPLPYCMPSTDEYEKLTKSSNVWAERKSLGPVYPWNFEEKIDMKKSAENFIVRMVRRCSYLSGENALPKNSVLYEKFMVLDELNNLKINGEKLTVEQKQALYMELFGKGKKVNISNLEGYLVRNGFVERENVKNAISGIDGGFKSSLSTVGKFYGIFGDKVMSDENVRIMEDIVFWGVVYGNDRKMLKEKIEEKYDGKFTGQELKRICGFKFEGWGRLSRSFLEMEGVSKEDGVRRTFIGGLWETNDNHMELLSSRYTYIECLENMTKQAEKPLVEWTIEDLNDMYLSAPVKRMVWQTLSIVKELEEVIGSAPERIFVEMAREDGEKNKRTVSRKQKLVDLYKSLGKEGKEWCEKIQKVEEVEFKNRKLYLYYLQLGKCMYTGQTIDLYTLLNSNNMYDIDHIYPQHYVKDDSIENNLVLALKDYNNNIKKDIVPLPVETRAKQKSFWKLLRDKEFITEEKYNRLMRNKMFEPEELAGFINRQLVETRQGTKAITQILKQAFPKTEIIFTKAGVVSDFRHKYDLIKVRCVNNYHHAHDAYLNIVVGNTYYTKFTRNPINFIKEAIKHPEKEFYKYHMDKIFDWDVKRNEKYAWIATGEGKEGTIKTVKDTLEQKLYWKLPMVTKYCAEYHGGITRKVTIYGKDVAKEGSYIPVKMNDKRMQDVTKYGGLTNIAVSGYSLIEYKIKGNTVRSLESIPVFLGRVSLISVEELVEYFSKIIQAENSKTVISDVRVCYKFIPSDALIKYNGFYYYLGGKSNDVIAVKSACEIYFDYKSMNYIKKVEKAVLTKDFEEANKYGEKIITNERNNDFYNLLIKKYNNDIFSKQVGTMKKIVIGGEVKFSELTLADQCNVLIEIINNLYMNTRANMKSIGGNGQSGIMTISKKISNAEEAVLIHQSVTGLYRAEVNLLTV